MNSCAPCLSFMTSFNSHINFEVGTKMIPIFLKKLMNIWRG